MTVLVLGLVLGSLSWGSPAVHASEPVNQPSGSPVNAQYRDAHTQALEQAASEVGGANNFVWTPPHPAVPPGDGSTCS